MILHYIKIAYRSILRNKVYALINILGLAVGLGVSLLIYQYVVFELSYDGFHTKSETTYRVRLDYFRNSSLSSSEVLTPHGLGTAAKASIPEIEQMARVRPMHNNEGVVIENPESDHKFLEYNIYYVDKAFFDVFDFQFESGHRQSVFERNHEIVLTQQSALKYFGKVDPLGKRLNIKGGNLSGEFIVAGVLDKLPGNTHFDFDFLLPIDFMLTHYGIYTRNDGWGWYNFYTYVNINNQANPQLLSQKIDQLIRSKIGHDLEQENITIKSGLQRLTDIHLISDFDSDLTIADSKENVVFYGIVGFIILLVAYLNYINLSTAQAIHRKKEVGVRKCLGVQRRQLIFQFLTESMFINLIAVLIGIAIAHALLPVINQIIGKEVALNILQSPVKIGLLISISIVGAILSGIYPAFVLSGYTPTSIFRPIVNQHQGGISLRKILIGLQFCISLLLIACTFTVYNQIIFMKNEELGIDMDRIIVVPGPRVVLEEGREQLPEKYQTFKTEIKSHHTIHAITGTSNVPGKGIVWHGDMRKFGNPIDDVKEGQAVLVDANFTDAFDFEFLSGEKFNPDMEEYSAVIINEKAVEEFGLINPQEAIGQSIIMSNVDTMRITGVVKNAHWSSLRERIYPTIFGIADYNAYFSIRCNLSNLPETVSHIESVFKSSFPNDPFEYYFLEDSFNRQYQADVQFRNLFGLFTILAIFLASIGLYALVAFSVSLKTKEIGIRKVLGASISNIIILLTKEYFIILGLAGLITGPLIFVGAQKWLEGFAYRINPGIEILVVPLVVLLIASFLTMFHKTFQYAKGNPVESLRNE